MQSETINVFAIRGLEAEVNSLFNVLEILFAGRAGVLIMLKLT